MDIKDLGWNEYFEKQFEIYYEQGFVPGRIFREVRHLYTLYTSEGVCSGEVSGHFQFTAADRSDYPTVGDWVALRKSDGISMIEKVLDRRSYFSRKSAGLRTEEQIVAANIDHLCIVCGLDGGRNFNLRGIERYIAMTREGGAEAVVILNKSDLSDDAAAAVSGVKKIGGDIRVYAVSALTGEGLDLLEAAFPAGATVAFTGHSGVGKSSLINAITERSDLKTGGLRESDLRGRHTTTHKEVFFLKNGAMVIDTPGMRELQLWGDEQSLDDAFADISAAAENCRFSDCTHAGEPGCEVQRLVDCGEIEEGRFGNYMKMRSELRFLESRNAGKERQERKAKAKGLSKTIRRYYRDVIS